MTTISTPSSVSSDPLARLNDMLGDMVADSGESDGFARQQAAILAFGRRAAAQPPLNILMQDAAILPADLFEADLYGVGEVIANMTALSLCVRTNDGQDKPGDILPHKCSLDPATSMAAYALSAAGPVWSPNLASEKRFTDLHLRKQGVASALTVPLHVGGRPFGVLGIYRKTEREFTDDDVRFTETIAHLLTSSIARIQVEEELAQERRSATVVLETIDSLVMTLDDDGQILTMNQACQRVTRFHPKEVVGKQFWNILVTPEERDLVRGIFRSSRRDGSPCQFEGTILAKDGTRKTVAWAVQVIDEGGGRLTILSGVDRTDQIALETELQQVKEKSERAFGKLKELQAAGDSDASETTDRQTPGATGARAGAYQAVDKKTGKERRKSPRRTYRYPQKIAPMHGCAVPSPGQFFNVECRDISAGGVSFFLPTPPDFETLVVELGKKPTERYYTARVARVEEVQCDGKKEYMVGCRFTGRIQI